MEPPICNFYEVKYKTPLSLSNSTPRYLLKETENVNKKMCMGIFTEFGIYWMWV